MEFGWQSACFDLEMAPDLEAPEAEEPPAATDHQEVEDAKPCESPEEETPSVKERKEEEESKAQ